MTPGSLPFARNMEYASYGQPIVISADFPRFASLIRLSRRALDLSFPARIARDACDRGREPNLKRYFVDLFADEPYGTLYVGVTGDLAERAWQHKSDLIDGLMKTYGVHLLVWFEEWRDVRDAIDREKQNPSWYEDFLK